MDFVGFDECQDDDYVVSLEGFDVFVDLESVFCVDGVMIDFVQCLQEVGFKFDNLNLFWVDNFMVECVVVVIEEQINLGIVFYGGFVILFDVKDDIVYILMGGGCQGCLVVDVMFKYGIELVIFEYVFEIQYVFDMMDYVVGMNLYYCG